MNKRFLWLVFFLYYTFCNGQSQNEKITRPTPSVAGLSTYSRVPVSIQTGIPEISYPLINLETKNKSVNVNIGLSYHAANTSIKEWSSEVGKGWTFLSGGSISREIFGDFDESYDDSSFHAYQKNQFDDIYNFNIPGESGKFRFIRDTTNNTFEIIKLTPFTSKIEYTRTSNQATLILDSFTIISDTGIKYIFKDYDINTMNVLLWYHPDPEVGDVYTDKKYRSSFYLSSVHDENDQELVKYTYLRDLKYAPGMSNFPPDTETNKLTHIEAKEHGIVEINYNKDESRRKNNDIFAINNVVLKTVNNVFIKKYTFEYSYDQYQPNSWETALASTRILQSFSQIDSNEKIIEKYKFKNISFEYENGDVYSILNRVQLPTGGIIIYNFEMMPHSFDTKTTEIPAPKVLLSKLSYDKTNDGQKYAFTLTEPEVIEIDASGIGNLSSYLWAFQFWKKNGNSFVASHGIGVPVDPNPNFQYVQTRTFEPGEYYADLLCNEDNCNNLEIYSPMIIKLSKQTGLPTTETKQIPKAGLPRINNIKYFNNLAFNITNPDMLGTPVTIEEYDYNKFDTSDNSGYLVEGGTFNGTEKANPVFIYKNVKVSQGNNIGYTKYYFIAPDTYPYQENNKFWPNYNITRGGLINKKEVYNSLNKKLSEEIFDYTIEEFDAPKYWVVPSSNVKNFLIKTSWIKNNTIISKNYFDSALSETKKEILRNTFNYRFDFERSTSSDGSILETKYNYAYQKGNQLMISKNMVGILLETVTSKTIGNATKTISKVETVYPPAIPTSQTGNLVLPLSVRSFNIQNPTDSNSATTDITYDQYDTKGNLQQYTTKDGISTVIIWGYNQTQPIAKIENVKLADIGQSFITDIVNASNTDASAGTNNDETNLLNAFNTFRGQLSGYKITTYSYDPLIGVRSITPPSGIREVYVYDAANRLKEIRENSQSGNLLKEFKYNYKQ
ncbi:hypothetical protein EG352_01030 [Chryseobacterium indologenes]|uniref:YD repeat-containing protein n=1 Tax=Chryseobacterium indologenes TaxID=253 RepID=A0AAD0YS94_CHRID|nr:hypothetical protein [Chryseobacterium indologenes]AZB16460.1 hypothetical protein EG352_01030 [Chryseobacterium indologenes]